MLLLPKLSSQISKAHASHSGTSAIFRQIRFCFIPQTPINQVIATRTHMYPPR